MPVDRKQLLPNDVEVLMAADFLAERYASLIRLGVSVFLMVFLGLLVFSIGRINCWLVTVCLANLALAICGVYVTRRRIFRRWFPWVISAADALFLFGVGWFGPWLEVLPTGFAFALVSQWAIFLVLSIEALRAQAKTIFFQTVLICGLLSVLAWSPVAGHAEVSVTGLEQLFSNTSNLTRIAIILLSGTVLAAGAHRARGALKRAVIATRERAALQRFHPQEIKNQIVTGEIGRLAKGRRHTVCILFADLRNFTILSESLDPERVVKLLNSFRTRSERVIQDHGGVIDKFIGDGFLAVFGLVEPNDKDALNALNAGFALLGEIERWSAKRESEGRQHVSIGVGLHTGEVFVGVVGTERMEFTVIGDAVNVAQRLEAMTREAGCSLIASQTILSDAQFDPTGFDDWKTFPDVSLRGRTESLTAYGRFPVEKIGTARPVTPASRIIVDGRS